MAREAYQALSPEERRELVARRDIAKVRAHDVKRSGSPKRRASLLATSQRMRAKYPEKYRARTAVNNALRDGRLTKSPCEVCGTEKVEAHHDEGYDRPLVVRWLCHRHHRALHGTIRADLL